jgi:hypothetical protein
MLPFSKMQELIKRHTVAQLPPAQQQQRQGLQLQLPAQTDLHTVSTSSISNVQALMQRLIVARPGTDSVAAAITAIASAVCSSSSAGSDGGVGALLRPLLLSTSAAHGDS